VTSRPLFLYGTLRDGDILAAVLGRIVSDHHLVVASLPDCAAVYFHDRLYPALVQRAGSVAPGLLLTNATSDDLAALDAFEGDEYWRGPVQAATKAGLVAAEVYWPAIPVAPSARDWTLEHWVSEHKPRVLARETALARAARLGTGRR
jgi:gamma-glutamylcyclotransferase (GGCT)/AIG2-like uncharacterized protein YtfP